jgi:hypothetical protein
MILLDFLRENEVSLSKRGVSAMGRAIRDIYPNMGMWLKHDDETMVGRMIVIDLPEKDCLQILVLTARYAGLWAFA